MRLWCGQDLSLFLKFRTKKHIHHVRLLTLVGFFVCNMQTVSSVFETTALRRVSNGHSKQIVRAFRSLRHVTLIIQPIDKQSKRLVSRGSFVVCASHRKPSMHNLCKPPIDINLIFDASRDKTTLSHIINPNSCGLHERRRKCDSHRLLRNSNTAHNFWSVLLTLGLSF